MKHNLQKVFYVGNGECKECYIIKSFLNSYFLLPCKIYHSREWGDPPYWEIPSIMEELRFHFYSPSEHVVFENNEETMIFRIGIVENFYKEEYKNISDNIEDLKNDLECLVEDTNERIEKSKD